MDIIPPVIVVQGADRKYRVCEQRIVVNGIPVYQHTGLSFDTVTDALTEAANYRKTDYPECGCPGVCLATDGNPAEVEMDFP